MRWLNSRWVDDSLLWYRTNSRTVDYRAEEEVERLRFLRIKQQPDADWSVTNWEKVFLGLESNKEDAFTAKKVQLTDNMDRYLGGEVAEYEFHPWTAFRVKACLRSGKTLPYTILSRLTAKSQWKSTERLIEVYGELPGLSEVILEAVREVSNEGYRESLLQVMSGIITEHSDRADKVSEDRALKLVAAILNAWEAQERKAGAGARDREDRDLWDQGTLT